jgi:hypothetical protein
MPESSENREFLDSGMRQNDVIIMFILNAQQLNAKTLNTLVTHTQIQAQVSTNLGGCLTRHAFADVAVGVIQIAKQDGLFRTGLGTGRNLTLVDTMHTQCAAFHRAFTAR